MKVPTQLVYLQFDPIIPYYEVEDIESEDYCYTLRLPRRTISQYQRRRIVERIKADFEPFGDAFEFTTELPSTNPFGTPFTTLRFYFEPDFYNFGVTYFQVLAETCSADDTPTEDSLVNVVDFWAPFLGGVAENIDFLNMNPQEMAVLDAVDFIEFVWRMDPSAVLLEEFFGVPRPEGQNIQNYVTELIINGASNIGAHELGHVLGLRHHDSFTPIGGVIVGDEETSSLEFLNSLMNSPAFTWYAGFGSELADQALAQFYSFDAYFSERSAMKLHLSVLFKEQLIHLVQQERSSRRPLDVLVSESFLKRFNERNGAKNLPRTRVPNTLGDATSLDEEDEPDDNETPDIHRMSALAVYGSIDEHGEQDSYEFNMKEGTYLTIEVVSLVDYKFFNFIDPMVHVHLVEYDCDGEETSSTLLVSNDDEIESWDSWILDFPLPATGIYRVTVEPLPWSSLSPFATGDYALFMYTAGPGPDGPPSRQLLSTNKGKEKKRGLRSANSIRRRRDKIRSTIREQTRPLTAIVPPMMQNNFTGQIVRKN